MCWESESGSSNIIRDEQELELTLLGSTIRSLIVLVLRLRGFGGPMLHSCVLNMCGGECTSIYRAYFSYTYLR